MSLFLSPLPSIFLSCTTENKIEKEKGTGKNGHQEHWVQCWYIIPVITLVAGTKTKKEKSLSMTDTERPALVYGGLGN